MTKNRLQKAGLLFMALGLLTAIIYALIACFVLSSVPRFNIVIFCKVVLPAVFVIGMTLLDRLLGGLLATVASVPVLMGCIYSRVAAAETRADTAWFIITICFLLGGVLVLTSLAIHTPRKINAKA